MAYITIPALPLGAPLSGLEMFESVQSSVSVRLTANQIKAFASSTPSLTVADAATNTVSTAATLLHTTTGTPAAGFGTGLDFSAEVNSSTNFVGSQIQAVTTDVGIGTETFALAFRLMNLNVLSEVARFTANKRLGVGTSTPAVTVHSLVDDANNNGVTRTLQLTHTTNGVPGNNIGTGIAFEVETSAANNEIGAAIDAIAFDTLAAAEDFDLAFSLMTDGAPLAEVMRLKSTGRLGLNTSNPGATFEAVTNDAINNASVAVARFTHTTTSAPSVGIGTAIDLVTETSSGNNEIGAAIYTQSTNIAAGLEDFDLAFAVMQNGIAGIEVCRITSDLRFGINTSLPQTSLHAVTNDGATSTVTAVQRLTHTTSGTPAVGFGTGLEFEAETAASNFEVGATINAVIADPAAGAEDFNLVLSTMTAGAAANEKLRIGEVIYTPQPFGAGTIPDATAWIHAGAGTTTVAAADFDPGTLLTTPFQGAVEYEGRSLYFTPSGTQRAVVQAMQVFQLNANFNGNGAITTIQPFFPKVVNVQAGTRYQYELVATVANTAATAKSLQYALGGTATLLAHDYLVQSFFAAATTTVTADDMMRNAITGGFNTLVTVTVASGAAAGSFVVRICGSFDVSVAGTVDFSFGLTAVGTSVTIANGSQVSLWPIGAGNVQTEIGSWV